MKFFRKIAVKIKGHKKKVKQIYFFDILFFEYQRSGGDRYFKFLPSSKKEKSYASGTGERRVFYLKINRDNDFALICLQYWIDIINLLDADFYIICDNCKLKYKVLKNVTFKNLNIKFIKSKNPSLESVVKMMATPMWENAAYAHLTTFYHSKLHGFRDFWNIDADDAMFLASPPKMAEKIQAIEDYAKKNKVDNFSLDMHTSKSRDRYWSFGITYTQNNLDYFELFRKYSSLEWRKHSAFSMDKEFNIDRYFTFLRDKKIANNKIFCLNKCYFIHYGNFLVRRNHFGIYYWEAGKFTLPILLNGFGDKKYGELPIAKSVIEFEL